MAARLVKVEALIADLHSVLADLDASMSGPPHPTDVQAPGADPDAPLDHGLEGFARRHAQIVEEILDTALADVRASAFCPDRGSTWASEQGSGADAGAAVNGSGGGPSVNEERKG
jgi:hypothetical protein